MQQSFINYSMSVIVPGPADVRDGLKRFTAICTR